jgi:polyribonucleotide nucleotidyltransferase
MGKMMEVISEPRPELSPNAPRIITIQIDPEKIGKVIGPGGKMIRRIQTDYDVKIDIDEDGTVYIAGGLGAETARDEIELMTKEVEPGQIYTGKVVRIEPYGAFVEILPGIDGMVHISQLADYRVPNVEDVVNLGDDLMVMVIDVDPSGKIRFSRQAVLEGWTAEEAREKDKKGSSRGGNRGGRDRGGRDRRGGGRDRRGGKPRR